MQIVIFVFSFFYYFYFNLVGINQKYVTYLLTYLLRDEIFFNLQLSC